MDLLLLETGSYVLLENGTDRILLEQQVTVPTVPGLEYKVLDHRMHYATTDDRMHYEVAEP